MICIGNLKKNSNISVTSTAKQKNFLVFSFTYVSWFYEDFCMNSYSVDSNEVMKQGNEALNASSLQFLRSIKRFMALSQQCFTQHKCFIALTF
jgi:hypothetical protein